MRTAPRRVPDLTQTLFPVKFTDQPPQCRTGPQSMCTKFDRE